MKTIVPYLRYCWLINAVLLLLLAAAVFLYPVIFTLNHLGDPALQNKGTPRAALWFHKKLSPQYETWARDRVAAKAAAELSTDDLQETEWPVFGSMFYLWATEALQESWDKDNTLLKVAPKVYARATIDAATELILDPNHGKWVRDHWGEKYLHHENVFYRGLLISAITVHHKLTGDSSRLGQLRGLVKNLEEDIDNSPAGLLEDYPAECYPGDVVMAIAAIRRSDEALGTDHSEFVKRALRGFSGRALTPEGLPPYMAYAKTGDPGLARGCANSYICMNAPELWPGEAADWYAKYEAQFWQERAGIHGFREYPLDNHEFECYGGDMDAGPTFLGFGMAAAAFGLAAAKANGRYDHAYELGAQMLAGSWVLPDGTMLIPRVLSNAAHAPLLGEACILYNLAIQPKTNVPIQSGGKLPGFVWMLLGLYLSGFTILAIGAASLARFYLKSGEFKAHFPEIQMALWALLLAVSLLSFITAHYPLGYIAFLMALVLPNARPINHSNVFMPTIP